MNIGEELYLHNLTVDLVDGNIQPRIFSDMFDNNVKTSKSIRQNEFYGNIYKKVRNILKNISLDSSLNDTQLTAAGFPIAAIPRDQMLTTETFALTYTSKWLFDQQMTSQLIGFVTTAVFPFFLYQIFDLMRVTESKYEDNEFKYLYYLSVIKPLLDRDAQGANVNDKMKNTIARWWLFYTIHTLQDECRSLATDFISRLEITSNSTQINNFAAFEAAKFGIYNLRSKVREHLMKCFSEGSGNAAYEYVRRYIDEIAMVRLAHNEIGRLELKIDNEATTAVYKFNITDRCSWLKHKKRIANSFSHQLYVLDDRGMLEPQLDAREINSFITGNVAFSTGVESTVIKSPEDFMSLAIDPKNYIDVSRISNYINENGMQLPNTVESLAIIYNGSLRDVWFGANAISTLADSISALELKNRQDVMHLSNGMDIKNCGESYRFDNAVVAELGMKIMQRFWSLVIPETSVTGNLQIIYDNAFGVPLIDGIQGTSDQWYGTSLIKGLNENVYGNVVPVISFLDALRIDGAHVERGRTLMIGKELFVTLYSIFKSFGIEELKTKMLPWSDTLDAFPEDRDVYPEWTSAKGQAKSTTRINGYGDLIKENQCIKSLFNATNSSQMNCALTKALAIIMAYKTSAINIDQYGIINIFKQ